MSKLITLSKLKTALTPLIALINKKAERPNWNENNYDSVSYIENKPFGSEIKDVTIISKSIELYEWDAGVYEGGFTSRESLTKGNIYSVTINGVNYSCVCGYNSEWNELYLGDYYNVGKYPFCIYNYDNEYYLVYLSDEILTECEIIITGTKEVITKVPEKYLPELNNIGAKGEGFNAEIFNDYEGSWADGDYSHVEGYHADAAGFASHVEGEENYADGEAAHAEGIGTRAIDYASHAEGYYTQANGQYSHAEGSSTYAIGENSHAEGSFTHADGTSSHAEGSSTYAIGENSHAEGSTSKAIGTSAHAEGHSTAVGASSHAEGATYSVGTGAHSEGNSNSKTITISSVPSFPNDYLTTSHSMKSGMVIYRQSYSSWNKTASEIYAVITKVISEDGKKRITTNIPLFYNYSDGTVESELSNQSVKLIYYGAATGAYAHSEGTSTAYGNYSHGEGYKTLAIGNYSHSEGENTVAASAHQHVQGRYNVEDNSTTYLHIVGNGNYSPTMGTTYSNAHTLDWDGNAWFSGDVYVGSTYGRNKDEGSKKLATEEYVGTQLSSFAPIQIITWGAND